MQDLSLNIMDFIDNSIAAREAGGGVRLKSAPGRGTEVRAEFVPGHPDCKPLGDLEKTFHALKASHQEIEFRFRYRILEQEGQHETQTRGSR
jgi:hypothetical protein